MSQHDTGISGVTYSSLGTTFSLKGQKKCSEFLQKIIRREKKRPGAIHFTFCSDAELLKLNKKFLRHKTLTDILTFQYPGKTLNADIFISIPRIRENAKKFETLFHQELSRVMIHGVLHLCGYKDKSAIQKKKMRAKEDYYLQLFR